MEVFEFTHVRAQSSFYRLRHGFSVFLLTFGDETFLKPKLEAGDILLPGTTGKKLGI